MFTFVGFQINDIDQSGYSELMHLMEQRINKLRDTKITKIQIAITGHQGSGVSSLINALRGLYSDDPSAAEIGCVESIMERKYYIHPDNANFVFWELPGVGTRNFPQEKYIKLARFNEYDFIIIVSSSRFTMTDTWLAEKIQKLFPDSNLFFVRTKIDVDLDFIHKLSSIRMSDEAGHIFRIKKDCHYTLKEAGIQNPLVFMVDNNHRSKFEFGKLANMLVAKVSALKKDVLIRTIQGFTKEIVAAKYELCIERMNGITRQAAIAAMHSNRKNGERLEVKILKQELVHYRHQLGIDTNSLEIVARMSEIESEEDKISELNSETRMIFQNFEQFYFKHDKVVPSSWHSLPILGQYLLFGSYQKQCLSVLKIMLDKCMKIAPYRST
ncbi:hypothetical protein DPMN_055014 [Dreissena polymorpha]|uniref:IRG-type G domain-containing protein n=1 Tax=Dreissena polymorpha TaxID=45954 RepID=A0A9D4CRV4_DREPO|nr:hypothetical protein DPMN_055014 [Dreissena polymorpha]